MVLLQDFCFSLFVKVPRAGSPYLPADTSAQRKRKDLELGPLDSGLQSQGVSLSRGQN